MACNRFTGRTLLGALWVVSGIGCSPDESVPVIPSDLARLGADQVVLQMEHVVTVDGVRQARILADTAYRWRDSTSVALRGVDMTIYTETGQPRATVTSRTGRLDDRTEEMTAWGNVVLTIPGEARRIDSEELHYNPQVGRISSDSTFTMSAEGRVIRGVCFRSDVEFRNFRTQGEGQCTLPP
jgi:LPS export ABC transporter protein LptC